MTQAQTIATSLGDVTPDNEELQKEIDRLNRPVVVPLEHVLDLHNWLDAKRKARQSCRLMGASRTGKTVACTAYQLRNPPTQQKNQTPNIPVAYVMPPTKCTAKELFKEIIEALCYIPDRGSVGELRSRTMEVLKESKVEMLIIDEADRIKLELLPEVRDISDKLDISVVLVGTSTRIIAVLKRDEQIANRFRAHRTFGQLKGNDFTRTVAIWESKVLKLPLPSNLTSKSNISILSDASDGYIGRLDELLREAAIKSLVKGHKRIEKDVLEEVAKEYSWP